MGETKAMPHYRLFIDGEFCEGGGGQMASLNPATGRQWATFAAADASDVERAVAAARRTFCGDWAATTATERGRMLWRLGDLVEKNARQLGKIETADSGKLLAETEAQTRYVADYYRYYAGAADKIEGATLPIDKPGMRAWTVRRPIGVAAAVSPWNAQMFLTATKLGPALAAGCCVVLKASDIAPCAMLEFARLLPEAGFPAGAVSVLTGDAEHCAVPLTSHPDIDRIAFTGGPDVARHVVRNSAENFAVTTLELGGKSPLLVFEDADVESAVNGLIAGNFGASGQSCVAASRGLIHRSLMPKVIAAVGEKARSIVVGDPSDSATHVGPLCTAAQVKKIEKTLAAAVAQGAKVHFGGAALSEKGGNYFPPTLVECPHAEIETLKVEMFGPVMSLLAFESEDEAAALANDSVYGLAAGIFTNDLARAHRMSQRLRTGVCWINTYRAISPIAPFGGFNQSGYGREAGMAAIDDYTRVQTVWLDVSGRPMANPFVMR